MTAKKLTLIAGVLGTAVGTGVGAFAHSRAIAPEATEERTAPAYSTMSAPAPTTAEFLRELHALRQEQSEGFRALGERVSKIEGIMQGEREARR